MSQPKQQPEKVREFLDAVETNVGDRAAGVAERIVEWAHAHGMRDYFFSNPNVHGSAYGPVITGIPEWDPMPLSISDLRGDVWVEGDVKKHAPFNQEFKFGQWLVRVHAVPGMVPKEHIPHISLDALADEETWQAFTSLMDWVVIQIKKFN